MEPEPAVAPHKIMVLPPTSTLQTVKERLRFLWTKRAIPGWILSAIPFIKPILSALKGISEAISHWQNIQWIRDKVHRISVGGHGEVVMFTVGLLWLTAVAFWPRKQLSLPSTAAKASEDSDSSQRILALCKELQAFLNDLGPAPQIIWRSGMSAEEFNEENKDSQIRERKMEAMFYRRFYQRVIDTYNEACESGTIYDAELEGLLRVRMDNDDNIKKVIERLAAVAADVVVKQHQ